MKQYAVICDFSHLFHLSRHAAIAAGSDYDTFRTTIANVEGKLRTVKRELEKLKIVGYDFIFAEDRQPIIKQQLYPPYKNNGRIDHSEEKNRVKQHLVNNGYAKRFVWSEGNEADDVIATLARLATSAGQHVVCVTGDRDIWQLLSHDVSIYNPIKQKFVTDDDSLKAFNCTAAYIPLHKTIWGDAGDCVPNVLPRMQKHLLPIVISSDGTLADFHNKMYDARFSINSKCWERYVVAKFAEKQLSINYELVKLNAECSLIWG